MKGISFSNKYLLLACLTLIIGWSLQRKTTPAWLEKVPRFSFQEAHVPFQNDTNYLGGLFSSANEIIHPVRGHTKGQIPGWLKGVLLKNGPGLFEFGNGEEVAHVFDGQAMIQGHNILNSSQSVISRRLIQSDILKKNLNEKRFAGLGAWAVPSEWTMIDRLKAMTGGGMADNSNVAIISLFGHFYATTESPIVHEFDPITQATIGRVEIAKIAPALKDMKTMTPHPLHDQDGTLWNLGMFVTSTGIKTGIFKVPPPQNEEQKKNPWLNAQLVTTVPSSRSFSFPYFHSFWMTPKYVIYPEQPYIIADVFVAFWHFVVKGGSFMDTMYWDKSSMTSFKIIEKTTGKVLPSQYTTEPMAFFHIINAYEESDHIILDAPFNSKQSYDFMNMNLVKAPAEDLSKMLFERGKDPRGVLRFALPLSTPEFEGNVKEIQSMGGTRSFLVDTSSVYLHPEYLAPPDQISSMKMEFPAVSPKFQGKKYEVAYGIEFRKGVIHGSGITKLDLKKKKFVKQWEDGTCYVSEPLFVPKPGSADETDGVLVFTCLNPDQTNPWTSLVVLSHDLDEIGRVKFQGVASPASFHGAWMPHT